MPTSKKSSRYRWQMDSPEAMRQWGGRLARLLRTGDVVALVGELGAGKTTLVQGVASGLGYRRGANSPTFALVNEYRTRRGKVYHMDMYRLSERELDAFPLEDYWQEGVCFVEWADRVRSRWPSGTLEVDLLTVGPRRRVIHVRAPDAQWRARLKALAAS